MPKIKEETILTAELTQDEKTAIKNLMHLYGNCSKTNYVDQEVLLGRMYSIVEKITTEALELD